MNLKVDYQVGTTVAFGDAVDYSCIDGFYFDIDFNLEGFNATCFPNGTWSIPIWQACVDPASKTLCIVTICPFMIF